MSKAVNVFIVLLLAVTALSADNLGPARDPAQAPSHNGPITPVGPAFSTGIARPGGHAAYPADAVLLTESFDSTFFPPPGWTRIITDSSFTGTNPAHWDTFGVGSTMTPRTPPRCAGMWWSYNTQQEWLITPAIALTGGTSYQLEWWTYGYRGSPHGDHFYTKISTNGGSSWTVLWDMSNETTPPDTGWNYWVTPYQLDISSYAGQTVKIAWHADDGTGGPGVWWAWGIDDVSITSSGGGPAAWQFWGLMPVGLMDNQVAATSGATWLAGGYTTLGDSGRTIYSNDLVSRTWVPKAPLPMPLSNGGAGIIGDTLYVCGGYSYRLGTTVDTLFKYSIAGDNWTSAPGPFSGTTYNWSPMVVVCAGKLYYMSGCNVPGATNPTTEVWAYTPGTGWAAASNMNQGRVFAHAAAYHDTIWVAGGNANTVALSHTEFYAPTTNTWTVNPSVFPVLPGPIWAGAAGVAQGMMFINGGVDAAGLRDSSDFFSFGTRTWMPRVRALITRYRFAGTGNSRDEMTAFGGDNGTFSPTDTVQYIASTGVAEAPAPGAYNLRLSVTPNPAHGLVAVRFNLPRAGHISAGIYDLNGRLVRTLAEQSLTPGSHQLTWNRTDNAGRSVMNGTYICRVTMAGASLSLKTVILN